VRFCQALIWRTGVLELVSYGLTGLAATVVMAFCCAYSDAISLREKRSIDLMNRRHSPLSLRAGERSAGSISIGVSSKSAPGETFHG
jgi:hypothetical protein